MNGIARFLKKRWVLYILLLTPVFYLFIPQSRSDTEYLADPAKYLLEYVGLSATILFVIVLMITPLRKIFPKSPIIKAFAFNRRQIGVSVFIYALLHLLIYFAYTGSWSGFVKDWEKLFILSGIVALVLLLVLATTSNNRSVRILGGKRWKRIHRLAYAIMFLLIYHQATQEKTGYRETAKIFAPLLLLQACRIGLHAKYTFDQRSKG
ncbi:MAG: ferric reductase-like transmembrane domain-containing protein [Opitutales bacterium]